MPVLAPEQLQHAGRRLRLVPRRRALRGPLLRRARQVLQQRPLRQLLRRRRILLRHRRHAELLRHGLDVLPARRPQRRRQTLGRMLRGGLAVLRRRRIGAGELLRSTFQVLPKRRARLLQVSASHEALK